MSQLNLKSFFCFLLRTLRARANGISGIWLNRAENLSWRGGSIPIDQYKINSDTNYKVIRKPGGRIQQVQDVQVKYLNPPQTAPAGSLGSTFFCRMTFIFILNLKKAILQ